MRFFHSSLCLGLLTAYLSAARADEPPTDKPKPAEAEPDPAMLQAKERFDKSKQLFEKQLYGAALAEAIESMRIYPAYGSTLLAARSLRELGRFDESLDTYALLLRDFEDRLKKTKGDGATYRAVLGEIDALRKLVGKIEIEGAEIGAMIVVDLRARGDYPLLEALRVPSGTHLVRVYKEGYEPFETRIDIAGGTTGRVVAPLVKLKATGTLQVVETSGKELDVLVDGLPIGQTGDVPWQGLVAPGEHTVFLRGEGDLGTAPLVVKVKADAVTPLRLTAEALTSKLFIQAEPAGAEVALDGVSLGRGLWAGKLKPGKHRVEIAADGFVLQVKEIEIGEGKQAKIDTSLERDPLSPLWKDNRGRFFVEANVGPSIVPTFGGDVAGACGSNCSGLPGFGLFALGRGGYRFPSGFVVGVDVGYVYARQSISGRSASSLPTGLAPNAGMVDDTLSFGAAMVGASGGIRLGEKLPLTFRLGAGVLLGSMQDRRAGSFQTVARAIVPEVSTYSVEAAQTHSMTSLYVAPEARIGFPVAKRLEISAGILGLVSIAIARPTWAPEQSKLFAATDGQAIFAADALSGRVWLGVQVGFGARYEF